MTTQTALWLPKIGAEFLLGKDEIPEPGHGEVIVKLEAAAINPLDSVIQQHGFFQVTEYPAVIGENACGVVQKVGTGVTNLAVGDRVTFQSPYGVKYGTFQQYCLAVAEPASKVPENVSFDEAAPICFSPFAVATYAEHPRGLGLIPPFEAEGLGRYAKEPIIIVGGATSLGQYDIQLSKLSGFNPIITTASLKNKELLTELGATHVLDRKLPVAELKEQVIEIVGSPVSYVFDVVSEKEAQQNAYALLAPAGTLAIVNFQLLKEDEASQKKVFMVYGSFHVPENRALGAKFAAALTTWLKEGKIKPNAVEVLPEGLNGIQDGLKKMASGSSAKKLVVRVFETRA